MTSQTSTVTKTVVTRSWRDIDPKVAIAAAVTAVCDLVLVVLFLSGSIDAATLTAGVGPASAAVVAAYVKRSTHVDVPAIAAGAAADIAVAGPLVDAVVPEAQPVVDAVEDGVAAIQQQLQVGSPLTQA